MQNQVKILLEEGGRLPVLASKGAIAYDLYCPKNTIIKTGRQVVPLNFRIEIPEGFEGKIEPRSGFTVKGFEGHALSDTECKLETHRFDADVYTGKIDSDYRGIVGVLVVNRDHPFILSEGTRFAQLSFYKVLLPELLEVSELSSTERADGGFGHSGTH